MVSIHTRPIRALALAISLTFACANAQSPTATIVGVVRDSSGGALPGAAIKLRNIETNELRVAESQPEGEFTLVQDEFDIQDGMDVTLWIHPVGTPLEEIVQR